MINLKNWKFGSTLTMVLLITIMMMNVRSAQGATMAGTNLIQDSSSCCHYWAANGNNIYNTNSGNVGIGTTVPNSKLAVNGAIAIGTSSAYYAGTAPAGGAIIGGNVGIGNWAPEGKLHVSDGSVQAMLASSGYNTAGYFSDGSREVLLGYDGIYSVYSTGGRNYFQSNVGIGTTNPQAKLHVNGDIRLSKGDRTIKVESDNLTNGDNLAITAGDAGAMTTGGNLYLAGGWGGLKSGDVILAYNGFLYQGNVGIGTTSPVGILDVNAYGNRVVINSSGNVGIGITSPKAKLVVEKGAISHDNNNIFYGSNAGTHINLGINSVTGKEGEDFEYCTIGGGVNNAAQNYSATVSGGYYNIASGYASIVAGGSNNTASSGYATIGGGYGNNASSGYTTVAGGDRNTASGYESTISGGIGNIASGEYSMVPGGFYNTAAGDYSWAGGRYMQLTAEADRTFVWGYANNPVSISAPDAFIIYSGNVGIGITNPSQKLHVYNSSADARMLVQSGNGGGYLDLKGTNKWIGLQLNTAGPTWYIGQRGNDDLSFYHPSMDNDYLTIKHSTGNVGVGVTNPQAKLEIKGNVLASGEIKSTGYLQLGASGSYPPPQSDCDSDEEKGRLYTQINKTNRLYICTGRSGWNYVELKR